MIYFLYLLSFISASTHGKIHNSTKIRFKREPEAPACECGKGQEGSFYFKIVDGYSPNSRPWMAAIAVLDRQFTGFSICAGSIIAKEWIITAAHCLQGASGNESIIDPKSQVKVFYGSDMLNIYYNYNAIREILTTWKSVDAIFPHEKYIDSIIGEYDIGLIKVSKKIQFNAHVMPICMPTTTSQHYDSLDAYTAGWGTLYDIKPTDFDPNGSCLTNHQGQNPYQICTSKCSQRPSPAVQDDLCRKIRNSVPGFSMTDWQQVRIYKGGSDELLTTCFHESHENGWCETCDRLYPELCQRGWGYCSDWCYKAWPPRSNILQEAKMVIFPCQTPPVYLPPPGQLCAGGTFDIRVDAFRYWQDIDAFTRSEDDQRIERFIGGSSACHGDSGGPLWQWKEEPKKHAVLIGISELTEFCGLKDIPGHFTAVRDYMQWIKGFTNDFYTCA